MPLTTVGQLVIALNKHPHSLPVQVLDQGSSNPDAPRDFQAFKVLRVDVGSSGTGQNPPKTVFVEVSPTA